MLEELPALTRIRQFAFVRFAIVAAALLVIGLVAAPGAAAQCTEKPGSVIARIEKSGVLRVGVPIQLHWSDKNPNTGKWEGIAVDLMRQLASQMGVKPEFKQVGWDVFPVALHNCNIDIYAGTAHFTVPRGEKVAFPYPIYWKGSGIVVLTKNADKYHSLEDFNKPGVTIAVGVGTYEDQMAKYFYPKAKIIAMSSGSHVLLTEAVKAGKADAAAFGQLNAWDFSKRFSWLSMPVPPYAPSMESFPIRYGDPQWLAFLNSYFRNAVQSGLVDQLVKQEFPNMPKSIREIAH